MTENTFQAIFQDKKGRLWVSFEAKTLEEWCPTNTGLSWETCGSRPWDNSDLKFVGVRAPQNGMAETPKPSLAAAAVNSFKAAARSFLQGLRGNRVVRA